VDEVEEKIKQAAIDGANLIQSMIMDPEFTDATRLAAAKYAIERAAAKDGAADQDNSVLAIMQMIRQISSTKELPPATDLPGIEAKKDENDWDTWIAANFHKPN